MLVGLVSPSSSRTRERDQKNSRIRCAETKKEEKNEMRVSGREEEAFFFGSRSSLETVELAQGLVQSGMDLDVLLFSISQFICNEKKKKNSQKESK